MGSVVNETHRKLCWYNPAEPQDAVLEPGLDGGSWFLPIFGSVFLLVGVGIFRLLMRMGQFMAEPG